MAEITSSSLDYTWKITSLRKSTKENINDVIVNVQWELKGTDEDGDFGTFSGATPFELDAENTGSFVPFEELTEEIVIGWVKDVVVDSYWAHVNEKIQQQIDDIKTPIVDVNSYDLPWASVSSSYEVPTS